MISKSIIDTVFVYGALRILNMESINKKPNSKSGIYLYAAEDDFNDGRNIAGFDPEFLK